MKTVEVCLSVYVAVTVDETKFTPEFFAEFNANIFDAGDDLEAHYEHLAQLALRGVIDGDDPDEFIEGYGPAQDVGIKVRLMDLIVEGVEQAQ